MSALPGDSSFRIPFSIQNSALSILPRPRLDFASCSHMFEGHAPLAQLAEQLTLNQRVPGSSPGWRILPPIAAGGGFLLAAAAATPTDNKLYVAYDLGGWNKGTRRDVIGRTLAIEQTAAAPTRGFSNRG